MRLCTGWGRVGISLGAWCALVSGCGDDSTRASNSDGQSGTAVTATGPTGTTDESVTMSQASASDAGSASMSASQTTPATATVTDSTPTGESGTGPATLSDATTQTDATSDSDSTPGTDTGPGSDSSTGEPACEGMGQGGFDFSYLWVANTDQGSLSKVNTETRIEEARYYADLSQNGVASTSRTSVNITGRFVAVSNRGTGWVTKVAANVTDCEDKDGNGMIETSPDKDTLLPWGTDNCVLWSTQVTNNVFSVGAGPRGTTWTPGDFNPATCKYENQKVWVGWLAAPGQAVMGRLNGDTGELEVTVPLPDWPISIDAPNAYAPYGAAVDADGFVWTSAVFADKVWRIDPVTLEVKVWSGGNGDSHYGMTTDGKGNVWFANWQGHGGVSFFDSNAETFTVIPGSEGNVFRGIAVGADGNVWVANNGGALGCGLIQISAETQTVVTFHQFPQCGTPVGVSVDVAGKVWMVDYNGWAYKIDPETYNKELVTIASVHYTYSDMTGGGLLNAVMPQ